MSQFRFHGVEDDNTMTYYVLTWYVLGSHSSIYSPFLSQQANSQAPLGGVQYLAHGFANVHIACDKELQLMPLDVPPHFHSMVSNFWGYSSQSLQHVNYAHLLQPIEEPSAQLGVPSPEDFSRAISILPVHEHSSITRYVKIEDRKRAFVSRLLQYALVHQILRIPFHQIIIRRTAQGKPYVFPGFQKFSEMGPEFPNFNFNVSHHGDFVAIASEPFCLVGLDIVFHALPAEQIIPEYIDTFSPYFSTMEWYSIMNAGTCDDRLKVLHSDEFFTHFHMSILRTANLCVLIEKLNRYWTLKESFVKAIGTGMGYPLDILEFHHINWTNIYVNINKKEARDWKFWHFELKEGLFVSVARGSPCMATESYKQALGQIDLDEGAYDLWLNLPNPSFLWKTVEELIPN
ncbi:hypothetical protein KSS87_014209 [Heliosperma pusillum]|nr:hypothetical protein KSS87_014209 [Heliosperma pusillum]